MGEEFKQSKAFYFLVTSACFVVVVAGMRAAESILVPFLLSALIAFVCSSPLFWLQKKGIPSVLSVLIVVVGILIISVLLAMLVGTSLENFSIALPSYQARIQEKTAVLVMWLKNNGIDLSTHELLKFFNPGKIMQLVGNMFSGLGGMLTNTLLILVTVIFILLEASSFPNKLRAILGARGELFTNFNKITDGIKYYLAIKTLTSFATGICIAIWLAVQGVDFPILWGLLAFLFNYVPNIGSIIAAIPVILLAFIQLGMGPALLVTLGYVLVNGIIGSVIEPKVMGRGVGLSTLVVFLSLVFWGWVLGPIGMLLSVPLSITLKIVLESSEDTRWIAILLGPEGSIEPVKPLN